MKILQIIPTLGSGGAEHFVVELSNELSRQGCDVELLSLFAIQTNNQLFTNLDSRVKVFSFNKRKGLWIRGFLLVWKIICRNNYDVVHGHIGAIKYMLLASILCRKRRFVATIHSEAKREAGKSIDKWSRKIMFGLKKCVPVTLSEESERSFEEFYGLKGIMIQNGVSEYINRMKVNLKENEEQTVFLHPASCQPVKNQELLFTAYNRLLEDGFNVKIVWVGSSLSYLELFNSLKPLMKDVLYLGVVDNVRDYMVASDAICLSSKMEGMPMTIIEAFSVGCPVICTPVGGCKNMVRNGENGFMSNDLSVDSYYETMLHFLNISKEDKRLLKEKAFESFKSYSIESCSKNYLQVYYNGYNAKS